MKNIAFFILLLTSTFASAQSSYAIRFQDEVVKIEENINSFQWDKMPASSKFQKGYYGWIQFFDTPIQDIQNDFREKGLELIEYLPNKAYVFYFPENTSIQYLKDNGVRSIVPIRGKYKLSPALKAQDYPFYALDGKNILATLEYHSHTNSNHVVRALAKYNIEVTREYKGHNIIDLSIPKDQLEALSNLSFVKWIELIAGPTVKHDTRGRSLHRSSNLDTQSPTGRNYTGKGISVMVRDDATIGPHIDFQGRLDNGNTAQFDPTENHGDGVAGIMSGAGNLDPSIRGMAAGADIYNVKDSQHFIDAETTDLIYNGTVQITNTSSGFTCRNGYTLNAVTVDQQIKDIPSLLHVLSAGNGNGNLDCDYGAGDQWGNLGGANKTGKNVIAAANVLFNGSLAVTSSRGPAADGRIKPDISAHGNGQVSTDENNGYYTFAGTSAASPGIAGITAQLYEAYGDLHGGDLPQSALIKAIMLNTTNDAGNIGPDYKFGWGIVNALRAAKTIEDSTYLSDNIAQGAINNHIINVPSGATQVRFMVYWSDVPGSVGANPALVNDLDLVVNDPANNTLLPWILDPTPNAVTLDNPATNGVDRLNNMEQVLINNPAAGDYTLDVSGFNVPMGPQEYFIVYEVISDNITVTYPNGGESFVPGETEAIHWDAINTTEDFDLEYSTDNGASWTSIATVSSNTTNYVWSVPSTVSGATLIKISSGSFIDSSDASFSISDEVEGFHFSQVCPDEVTFAWNELEGAESYDVYLLGDKYMEIVGTSMTTSITVPIADPTIALWAAIVAKSDTGNWASRRTVAVSSTVGLIDCELPNDLAMSEVENVPNDFLTICSDTDDITISALISNVGTAAQSNFEVSYQLSGQEAVVEVFTETLMPGQQIIFEFATPLLISAPNLYTLTIATNLNGDQNEFNNVGTLDFFGISSATPLDFEEDFETTGVPSNGWSIINGDENRTWIEASGIVGSDGNTTTAAFVDNYSYENGEGEEDFLVTEYFDLTSENAATLNFDIAKVQWNENLIDGFRVEISIDCGETFTSIYEKTGFDLATLPDFNSTPIWKPLIAEHWRTEEIDLAPYAGENVQFRFINVSGYGNSTYIDNVNINQILVSTDEPDLGEIRLFPNPATETVHLELSREIVADASFVITNGLGQIVHQQKVEGAITTAIDISNYTAGLYFVTTTSKGVSKAIKLIVQ